MKLRSLLRLDVGAVSTRYSRSLGALAAAACLALAGTALASGSSSSTPLISAPINENNTISIGSVPVQALNSRDLGPVADSLPLNHVFLQLTRSAAQEQALQNVINGISDPHSSTYRQFLTSDEVAKYGPAETDIATVVAWLTQQGLTVNKVSQSGMTIDLSGTAGQIGAAFHTSIHNIMYNGRQHISNMTVPRIPAALSAVVGGFVSLNDIRPQPQLIRPKKDFSFPCTGCPGGANGAEQFDIGPGDFAVIYNVEPLYKEKITGKGETVVVLEDSDILDADVATFRTAFGLNKFTGTFTQVHPGAGCADPGTQGSEDEAALDAEWAGAIAPDAAVMLASCADTATNFGGFIAAQNLLDEKDPPKIMSLSFGSCEADIGPGPTGNGFILALWEQAAAEGVSVFVSAGDGSAAGCDDFDTATFATQGIAASGFASTPFNVATGGTDFLDTALNQNSTYFSTKNNTATGTSALSYVPEMTWSDSCGSTVVINFINGASVTGPVSEDPVTFCNSATGQGFLDIAGGSGAPSIIYAKPFYQQGIPGNPNDGARDLPDVSLFASNGFFSHAIVFCFSDPTEGGTPCNFAVPADVFHNSAGGTSFTAPQYASIQALINQKAGGAQGNPNPVFYDLARTELKKAATIKACNATLGNQISNTCIFHDVTVGSNAVPCFGNIDCFGSNANDLGILSTSDKKEKPAYDAGQGWDFTTGLGSVNVTNLVEAWP
jgi:subtilase family serine protease